MKRKLTLLIAALALLTMGVLPGKAVGQTKITDYTKIVSGKTYYIGATLSNNTDYYLQLPANPQIGSYTGIPVTNISEASTFTFSGSGQSWTIQLSNGKYLSTLPTGGSSNNGKLSVANTGVTFTASNQSEKIRLSNNGRSIQRNNTASTSKFGSYANTQTDIWLMEVTPTCTASPTSWDFGGVTIGESASKTFTLTTANLTDDIDLAVYDDGAFTVSPTSIASTATSTEVTITFHPTMVSDWTDYLVISSDDFSDEELIELTGEGLCIAPTSTLAYTTPVNLTLTGSSADCTLTPTSGTGNNGTITYDLISGDANHCILVDGEFSADAVGTYVVRATQALNGNTCGGTFDITINVNGTTPICTIEPEVWDFDNVAIGVTAEKTFTVTTANLTGNVTLAMGNAAYSVSPAFIAQDASSTQITIAFTPTAAGEVESYLTANGGGINNDELAIVSGTGATPRTITFNPGTGSCTTTSMTGIDGSSITLPLASTVTAPEGWDFAGWCATNVETATTVAPTLLSGDYTINGDATLYAVYSKTEETAFNNTAGNFMIYAIVSGVKYYAVGTGSKLNSTTTSGDATTYTFEKPDGYEANEWAIKTGSTYITYSSNTNLGTSNSAYKWTISNGSYGTWRVTSETSGRAMIYRAGTTNKFGGYSTGNVSGTEYFDLEIGGTSTTYHTSPAAKVATPTIEVTGVGTGAENTYYETATVTLNCDTDEATIHYTTDGTNPTASAPTYSAPFAVTESSTIKAIAVRADFTDSDIVSQEINIVQPNTATFTDGVYSSLTASSDLDNWYKYDAGGEQAWFWYNNHSAARMSGYSSGNHANEDWLISPKMAVSDTPLAISFDCGADYGNGNDGAIPSVLYSTNYPGYGNPNSYSWTKLQDLPYDNDLTFTTLSMTIPANTQVFFAFKYVSTDSDCATIEIKNFTAKQCYPVIYNANDGTGTMTDANSPYAVGATVTTLANTFTPPTDMIFEGWNDGTNTYAEGATFTMPNNAVTLTAQWIYPCTVTATMGATEAEAVYVNNAGVKSYKITMSSMVTVLGGCDITEYGFVYSTIEEQPTLENATKLAVGSTYTVVETPFNGEIADAEGTYYVRAFAKNAAGPAYSDAAVTVVVPDTYPTCTISYKTNGVNEEETTQAYIGDVVTLFITPTQGNIPTGFTFAGWSASVSSTEVISSITPEEDITLHAVLDYGGTYDLVSNVSELHVGDIIVIAASEYDYAMSKTQNPNNRGQAGITKTDNQITLTDDVCEFVLGAGMTNGTWSFYDNNKSGYIYAASSSSNYLRTETDLSYNSSWVISISDNNASIVAQGSNTHKVMLYNNGSSIFSCYASASQKAISLYKKHSSSYINVLVEDLAGNIEITEPTYIPAGFIVDAGDHTITTTAANLIIEDGGQLIHTNAVNATLQKNITGASSWKNDPDGWYFVASPVDNAVITESFTISPLNAIDLFRYDEPSAYWMAYWDEPGFENMVRGSGYLHASQTAQTVNFAGEMINTEYEFIKPLSYECGYADLIGFNLVGNPFTRNLVEGEMTIGGSDLTLYYGINDETTGMEVKEIDENPIKPGQGFFVQATSTDQDLIINPSKKGETVDKGCIRIAAGNDDYMDKAYIQIKNGNTLRKMNIANSTKVYVMNGDDDYAATRVEELAGAMPVNFKAIEDGTYTITVETKNIDAYYLHLIDNFTNEDIDLLLEPTYTFTANADDAEGRFRLVFDFNDYTGIEENNTNSNFVYQFGNEILVNGEGTLQVFDVMGRLVTSFTVNGNERLSTSQLNTGVYIFRMVGSEVKTQKIVVR